LTFSQSCSRILEKESENQNEMKDETQNASNASRSLGVSNDSRSLIVQKYGGSSLARPEQIQAVADRIAALHKSGTNLIVVVSAMGKTTDQLVELAYKVSATPNRRELDMLLTTGERISMSLMSMALNERGCAAISFTGSQAGLLTDELHSNARIIDVKAARVEAELGRNNVVVLAGFQGVSPRTKEVTTLGRGGSDTTAVAMAAAFRAERCEILKDVDGVHSADPNVVSDSRPIAHLHYLELLDMTFWGAKVLHYRSVELAHLLNINLVVELSHGEGRRTLIDGKTHEANKMYEQARILSVNSHKDVRWLSVKKPTVAEAFQEISNLLKAHNLPIPQLLDTEKRGETWAFLITGPQETLNAIAHHANKNALFALDTAEIASVTATCQGSFASPLPEQIATALNSHQIGVHKMLFGAMSITAVIDGKHRDKAMQVIHSLAPSNHTA
jgi:aspartate kinase